MRIRGIFSNSGSKKGLGVVCGLLLLAGCTPAPNSVRESTETADSGTAESMDVTNTDAIAADAPDASPDKPVDEPTAEETEATAEFDPSLVKVGGKGDYQALLAERRGKVVLVDFWALWCVPCVKQFPHTAELSREHADDGLAVITVNFDDPESSESKVLEFLKKQDAPLPTLISEYGVGTESADQFEMPAGGALPGYKLYDRGGQLRFEFGALPQEGENLETPDKIDARVAELLAEQ